MNLQTICNALEPENKFFLWIDDTALFQLTLYLRLIFLITMSDPADQIKNDVIRIDVSHTYKLTSR